MKLLKKASLHLDFLTAHKKGIMNIVLQNCIILDINSNVSDKNVNVTLNTFETLLGLVLFGGFLFKNYSNTFIVLQQNH